MSDENQLASINSDFDLQCWYINEKRVMELMGSARVREKIGDFQAASEIEDLPIRRWTYDVFFKDEISRWLRSHGVETLGQQLISNSLSIGNLFTAYQRFFGKGLTEWRMKQISGKRPAKLPEIHARLTQFESQLEFRMPYSPEHLHTETAFSALSGSTRLFVFGFIDGLSSTEILAHPYVIASLSSHYKGGNELYADWENYREVHVDSIDNFALANDQPPPREGDLQALREIPEDQIKRAFAEIIGEPVVPKDWGGERSDLFTTYIRLRGERMSTAFAFKGPAEFRPMTMAVLGKNGDQIDRLFSEPADLLILQHCHFIKGPVRNAMRAYATQIDRPRRFCLIDGFDTIRVLRAYHKCGF